MIIQTAPHGGPRFAITMDEHTALAGQFADSFGNQMFEPVEPRETMLYVVSHHDRGWAALDAAPETDIRTGLPFNLVETPARYISQTSRGSPDFNEKHHAYCGLLSSMHSWGLYHGRYGLSDLMLIDNIAPEERPLVDRVLEGELERQARLKTALSKDPLTARWIEEEHLFQNYKQLQFFDTLALYFNRTHEGARQDMSFKHVPTNERDDVTVAIHPVATGIYRLSPYPFAERDAQFSFSGRYLEACPCGSRADWASLLASAPRQWQHFRLIP